MANYVGHTRTNYFRVQDREAFDAWVETLDDDAEVWERDDQVAFGFANAIPNYRFNPETEDYDEFDIFAELAEHLVEGEIAVIQSIGHEKLRALTSFSFAVRSDGDTVGMTNDEIYDRAHEWFGVPVTRAEY